VLLVRFCLLSVREEKMMIQNKIVRYSPKVLVENKVSFAAEGSELSIYDTYQQASQVGLSSDQLMFCGMVSGKKIMHSDGLHDVFLPHESFVMAPNQLVKIDFPEAKMETPTTCLAIEIAPERVHQVADQLNHVSPKSSAFGDWRYQHKVMHTHHTTQTQALLDRIVEIYTENNPDRQFLINLAVTELSARLLRQQTRDFIVGYCKQDPEANRMNAVVSYILANLALPLDVEQLLKIALMGRTKFFIEFKNHLGCSPIVFQQQERLKEAARLLEHGLQITETSFAVGFQNISHFSKTFKAFFGLSPTLYKQQKSNTLTLN
jgi:AraC-like DNA-binding protein